VQQKLGMRDLYLN